LWVPPDPDAAAPPPRTPAAAQVDAALFDGAEPEVEGGPVEAEAVPEVPREPFSWRRLPEIVGPRFFWLLIAGAIAIALSVAATVALTWWLERAPVETAPLAQQARQPERRPTPDPAPAPAPPVEDPAATAARLAAEGEAAMAARDFAAAVLAFGRVLEIDPKNADVRARLQVAGEEYKRVRTDVDRLQKARDDFAAGEYESALRIFYRLPEGTLPPPVLERYKIAGWYNLGVISLRGADCAKAVTHLTEAMTLAPRDPEVLAAKALADQCRSQAQDRSFYNKADSLPFRDLR
jgi:tetratricopeptide (TPR) repeat protein